MTNDFPNSIRSDFPILQTQMSGKPLIYFDNGATTQKPQCVIDALVHYYSHDNANIHRGLYELSQRATDAFEAARDTVARFIHAPSSKECLFVRGATEAINLVASSWGRVNLADGDEVIVTGLEHHSNIVPWQMACQQTGAKLRVLYPNADGELDLDELSSMLRGRSKMLAIQHVSNALGTIHDVAEICKRASAVGTKVLVDGAQWVSHFATDVQSLGCDFYTFSGHKLYAPTGIGVLWGKEELLEQMPPYQGGGDMIETVAFEKTTYAPLPNCFEAGTPNISGAIALKAAIEYLERIGIDRIAEYEQQLLDYATDKLRCVPGLRIVGNSSHKAAVISFTLEDPSIAPLDIANHLSHEGIAIRTGHHCCMPLMHQLHLTGTSRVSLAMYNTPEEVDQLNEALQRLVTSRTVTRNDSSNADSSQREVSFAGAAADSTDAAASELAEEFLEFDDRENKSELLMELGSNVPRDFETLKALSSPVPGCMSEVYLVGRPMLKQPERFEFSADSNAEIVRGLIALLQHLFSGQNAEDVVQFDVEGFFRRIGLEQFVSTQRRSGLDGMIRRIRTLAQAILERETENSGTQQA